MSKKVNVNPDHYKTAGRERQGEDVVQEIHRQKFAQEKAAARTTTKKTPRKQSAKKTTRGRAKS